MKITSEDIAFFRAKFEKAMAEISEETGFQVKIGSISFGEISFSASLKGDKIQSEGGKSVEQLKFEHECRFYDLEAEDFGKEFKYAGLIYKIVAINGRAKTYPIICEVIENGKRYRMTLDTVKRALGKTNQ